MLCSEGNTPGASIRLNNRMFSKRSQAIYSRGRPSNIFLDNATTFIKANKDLKEFFMQFAKQDTQEKLFSMAAEEGIKWHFIAHIFYIPYIYIYIYSSKSFKFWRNLGSLRFQDTFKEGCRNIFINHRRNAHLHNAN